MRSEIIKSSKHLDWNIYMWTDITIMVLPLNENDYKWTDIIIMVLQLNENDYKWTWMSFQFKGWDQKSSKHLDCNIDIWTDIIIIVLPLNENDYKWTDIIIIVLPLNENDYKWTDIIIMVLQLNENDYEWTWMSFQFKGWEVAWFSVSHMGKFKTNHFKSCHESVRSHFWKRNR